MNSNKTQLHIFHDLVNDSAFPSVYPSESPELIPVFSGVRVSQTPVFSVVFVDHCLFFCPLSFDHCTSIIYSSD